MSPVCTKTMKESGVSRQRCTALPACGGVGGAHARYFADYAPEILILRVTTDPAPRMLYCFEQREGSGDISVRALEKKLGRDIDTEELIIGSAIDIVELRDLDKNESGKIIAESPWRGATLDDGVKDAVTKCVARLNGSGAMTGVTSVASDTLVLRVDVPMTGLRPMWAREYQETYPASAAFHRLWHVALARRRGAGGQEQVRRFAHCARPGGKHGGVLLAKTRKRAHFSQIPSCGAKQTQRGSAGRPSSRLSGIVAGPGVLAVD